MENVKVKINEFLEKLKSDKKFMGIVLGGALVGFSILYLLYNSLFSYDLDCYFQEDGEYMRVQARFSDDEMVYFKTVTISEVEDENLDYLIEYFEEYADDLEDDGIETKFKISRNTVEFTMSADKKDVDADDYSYYFSDETLKELREDILSDGYTCTK